MGVPAWQSHPCWYLSQRRRPGYPAGSRAPVRHRMGATTIEVQSGHLAMLSHPDEVARLIETAAKAIQAEVKWSGR